MATTVDTAADAILEAYSRLTLAQRARWPAAMQREKKIQDMRLACDSTACGAAGTEPCVRCGGVLREYFFDRVMRLFTTSAAKFPKDDRIPRGIAALQEYVLVLPADDETARAAKHTTQDMFLRRWYEKISSGGVRGGYVRIMIEDTSVFADIERDASTQKFLGALGLSEKLDSLAPDEVRVISILIHNISIAARRYCGQPPPNDVHFAALMERLAAASVAGTDAPAAAAASKAAAAELFGSIFSGGQHIGLSIDKMLSGLGGTQKVVRDFMDPSTNPFMNGSMTAEQKAATKRAALGMAESVIDAIMAGDMSKISGAAGGGSGSSAPDT